MKSITKLHSMMAEVSNNIAKNYTSKCVIIDKT